MDLPVRVCRGALLCLGVQGRVATSAERVHAVQFTVRARQCKIMCLLS